jgi:hypothetical protein
MMRPYQIYAVKAIVDCVIRRGIRTPFSG